jgi:hypothetical protein
MQGQATLTSEQLVEGVGAPLAETGDAAHQAMTSLTSDAVARDRAVADARARFVQAFAELEAVAGPVKGVIEQIHQAYEKVDGMSAPPSWGTP